MSKPRPEPISVKAKHPQDPDLPGVPQQPFTILSHEGTSVVTVQGQAPERWAHE